MLQQIIQSYIEAEICNYGISGLNSVYKSGSGTYISVYLDRVHYDEANYTYKFDVVYVCTEQSTKYMAFAPDIFIVSGAFSYAIKSTRGLFS